MLDAVAGDRPGPWLCRHHRRAGVAADPRCCAAGVPLAGASDRGLWFTLRLATKPTDVLEAVGAAAGDPQFCLTVIARHVNTLGRRWTWGRAMHHSSTSSRDTQSIRILRAT